MDESVEQRNRNAGMPDLGSSASAVMDILETLASLNVDEIFTPPRLARDMVDLLPDEVWNNTSRFIDPCCKTGVFLREIAQKLSVKRNKESKAAQEILRKQIFGLPTSETADMLTKRTIYYSRNEKGEKSAIAGGYGVDNVKLVSTKHTYENGRCIFCGVNPKKYRENEYAYSFIHDGLKEFHDMKFDVIIGNPPYQLSDGATAGGKGSSASPIYQKFVEAALSHNPKHLVMVIPARWYTGGKGLDDFRKNVMYKSRNIVKIVDYANSKDCFPEVDIKGGVMYFLWSRDYEGDPTIWNFSNGKKGRGVKRPLLEDGIDVFIRNNDDIEIYKKILKKSRSAITNNNPGFMSETVSSSKPFGLRSNEIGFAKKSEGSVALWALVNNKAQIRYVNLSSINATKRSPLNKWKVLVPKAGGGMPTAPIIANPVILGPGIACTETWLIIGSFDNRREAENLESYVRTKFFQYMVAIMKLTQNMSRESFKYVPMLSTNKKWNDDELFRMFEINEAEAARIRARVPDLTSPEPKVIVG